MNAAAPLDSLTRFSDRVANYLKYRPDYPQAVVDFLVDVFRLSRESWVADIGSGTGKLSQALLSHDLQIVGIEPNREMREAGESLLAIHDGFESREGTAEATGLEDASVDLIVAGQAFHWFDRRLCKIEFKRILKKGGGVALVWNERSEASPFLAAYEKFLHEHAKEYSEVNHRRIDNAVFEGFFAPNRYSVFETDNCQYFTLRGLLGRYLSSSYSYNEDDPRFPAAKDALCKLFDWYSKDGKARFDYKTRVYYGKLG